MPIQIFESETSLSEKAVVSTLKSSLTKLDWLGFPKSSAPFLGSVSNSSFRVMRVIKGRDSFNPILYGRFHSSNEGTHIKVIMTYHPAVWLFILVWTILLGKSLFQELSSHDSTTIILLMLMLILPWILGVPLFFSNAKKSRILLQRRLHLIDTQSIGNEEKH